MLEKLLVGYHPKSFAMLTLLLLIRTEVHAIDKLKDYLVILLLYYQSKSGD